MYSIHICILYNMNTIYPPNIERILHNSDNENIDESFCNYVVSHQDLINNIIMTLAYNDNHNMYETCYENQIQQTILRLLEAAIIYGCSDLIIIIKNKYSYIDGNTPEHIRLMTIAKHDNNIFELMKNNFPSMFNAYISQKNYNDICDENVNEIIEIEETCQMSSQYL